jgi:hypothetical protein
MPTFVALYHGVTVGDARLVAVSADPRLVGDIATRMLSDTSLPEEPVVAELERGRRKALRLIRREAGTPVHA